MKQEIETRFGTHFLVAERFLKYAEKIWYVMKSHKRNAALGLYQDLAKEIDRDGLTVTGYPTIESIVDTFSVIHAATEKEGEEKACSTKAGSKPHVRCT